MSEFVARAVELAGEFTVAGPIAEAFELFSPLGEKRWVPGWNPELVHPPGASWEQGLIFRTREEGKEAVWIVTTLDRAAHKVEYHRVEPGRYVARVSVLCSARAEAKTHVATTLGLPTAARWTAVRGRLRKQLRTLDMRPRFSSNSSAGRAPRAGERGRRGQAAADRRRAP